MKIINLIIDKYKIIENMDIFFEKESSLNVLIGNNGSGKSTVLETIALIFKDLYKKSDEIKFDYKIEYLIKEKLIKISYEKEKNAYTYMIDGKKENKITKEILPEHIFSYYSGNNKILEKIYSKREEEFKTNAKDGEAIELRNLLYIKKEHLKICFLSTFLLNNKNSNIIIKKMLSIKKIESIKIELESPKNYNGVGVLKAKGSIEKFLKILTELNDISIIYDNKAYLDINEEEFLKLSNTENIFAKLEALISYGLIKKLEIKIKLNNTKIIDFDNLSEGEKQLLLFLSFITLTSSTEAIYLFDEPDTYLHPKWQRDVLSMINKLEINGQVFLTTHSPVLLSSNNIGNTYFMENGKLKKIEESSYLKDINTVLEDIMKVSRYSEEISALEQVFYQNILDSELTEANITLDRIKSKLSSDKVNPEDHELVLELSGIIFRMELLGYEENH